MYSSHQYPKGHVFFEEGSEGISAYIIKSGRVEITTQQANKEIVIDTFGRGEIFGEMALLGAKIRTATARAIERIEVIDISRAHLLDLLKKMNPILKHIVLSLTKRIQHTTTSVYPEKADDFGVSVCRILALIANQKSNSTDESQGILLPYTETIEQIEEILSIDACDCQLILEKLEITNLIETIQHQSSEDKFIRLVDQECFLQKAEQVLKEFEAWLPHRLNQKSICIDLYDLSEGIAVEREQIAKKIGEGEIPVELFFFRKDDILKWAIEVGPSSFEKEQKRISAVEDLDSLDAIVHVKNPIVRDVLSQMDFRQTCQLLKTASDPVKNKILTNLSRRIKQIAEHELDLIEEVDADEAEEVAEDFLDELRDVMKAELNGPPLHVEIM